MRKPFTALILSTLLISGVVATAMEDHVHAPGMLGVSLHEIMPEEVASLRLPGEYGAWVQQVGRGTPAEEAGIREDDVIVGYNGERVESARALRRMVLESPAGRRVELKVIRDGDPMLILPTLGEGVMPAATAQPPRSLGVWIESVDPVIGQFLDLEEGVGVIVREVQEGSPADRAGIRARDVLVSIDGEDILSAEQVSTTVQHSAMPSVTFVVARGIDLQEITVQL